MAAFQKEAGSVTSRDFSASGLMGKFKAWVVKTYGNGGPQWYIIDDQSASGTPYIVVCNLSSPNWYDDPKIIKVEMSTTTELITLVYYRWWDASTHTGYVVWHVGTLVTLTGSFAYDFRGGPECLFLSTRVSTTYYTTYIDEWEGIPNFIEDVTKTGITVSPFYNFTGNGSGSGWIRGIYGVTLPRNKVDANRKLYINLVNSSGNNYTLQVYNDSARTQLVCSSSNWTSAQNSTVVNINCTQQNSSGVSMTLQVAGTLSGSVSTIEMETFKFDLQSGEGANFTAGNSYFFRQGIAQVQYFQVESVSGDTLIVANGIVPPSNGYEAAFAASSVTGVGARISPYPGRYYAESSRYDTAGYGYTATQPVHDNMSLEYPNKSVGSGGGNSYYSSYSFLSVQNGMAPNEKGKYMMTRPIIYGSTGPNKRYLGKTKNMIVSSNSGLSPFLDGRTLNGNNWLCFNNNTVARLFRDWTSLS